jgi:hypothetical protein
MGSFLQTLPIWEHRCESRLRGRVQLALKAHHARSCEQAMVNTPCGHDRDYLDSHIVHEAEDGFQGHLWGHCHRWHLHFRALYDKGHWHSRAHCDLMCVFTWWHVAPCGWDLKKQPIGITPCTHQSGNRPNFKVPTEKRKCPMTGREVKDVCRGAR